MELNTKTYNLKPNSGFTIIETLVAVTILVMAVTGPLSLASKGLAYSQYAKDEITAFYLANEAMDAIRNVRDSNLRSYSTDSSRWIDLPNSTPPPPALTLIDKCDEGCTLDVWKNGFDIKGALSSADTIMKSCVVGTKVYYGYEFGEIPGCSDSANINDSIFSRVIKITEIPDDEIKVDVLVSWVAKNNIVRKVVLSENLFKIAL